MINKKINPIIGDENDLICIKCKKNKKMKLSAYCLDCKILLEPDYFKKLNDRKEGELYFDWVSKNGFMRFTDWEIKYLNQ